MAKFCERIRNRNAHRYPLSDYVDRVRKLENALEAILALPHPEGAYPDAVIEIAKEALWEDV